jgi:uncharacterized protein with PQ loop repeat
MNDELLKHALAVTGTVLYVARAAPATIQIARRREVDPEAATTFGLLLLTGLWWVAYSLEVHNLPSLLSAVLGLLAPAYGLLVLWRVRGIGRGVAFVLVAGLAVTFLEELTPRALGVTAAVGAAGIAVPQAARLLRDRDRSAAGASIGTWALVAFNALVWLVYGVLVGHPLLGAAGLLQLPCSMIVIYYALRGRGEPQPRESLGRGRGDPRAGLGRSLTSGRWRAPWSIDRRGASRSPRARGARAVSERRMRPGARLPRAPVEFFPVP